MMAGEGLSKCDRCRFSSPIYIGDGDELLRACVYILHTGKKRPGPAREDCAVYEPAEADAGCVSEE